MVADHTRPNNRTAPWFDPARLESPEGREALFKMAERYYQVTHDAVRRYDPHHLILGDRYEAKALLPDEVLLAAKPYVDVIGFQYFGEPNQVCEDFDRWHELTGRPTLLADPFAPKRNPDRYAEMMDAYLQAVRSPMHLKIATCQFLVSCDIGRNFGYIVRHLRDSRLYSFQINGPVARSRSRAHHPEGNPWTT